MRIHQRLWRGMAATLLALAGAAAWAQDDPPGRVGRVAELQGAVVIYDPEQGEWTPVARNRPLTSGDRLSTDAGGRAELRIGSTTLRLGGSSELEVLRIDDERISLQLHIGSLALRVRSREVADETELVTAETRLRPLRSGHYRIDRIDDGSFAASWRGELRADDGGDPFTIASGQRAEIWREGPQRSLQHRWVALPDDAFAGWALRDEQRDERSAANRHVSPEMTGAEELERNGRWEQHPDYGALWIPMVVQAGWAPYRFGHWAWIRPWGWTWVDDAPWGFAPFHYGRWVSWGGRWGWAPGSYVARPVYAPALVAWVGGPHLNVSVSIGGPLLPAVGWVPLAPREVFVPWYRASPVYGNRINHRPPGQPHGPVFAGPAVHRNQGVAGGVTMVPRDVMIRRQPVGRAAIDLQGREPLRRLPATPATAPEAPPAALLPRGGTGQGPVRGRPGLSPTIESSMPVPGLRPERAPPIAVPDRAGPRPPQAPQPRPQAPRTVTPGTAEGRHPPRPDRVFVAPPLTAPAPVAAPAAPPAVAAPPAAPPQPAKPKPPETRDDGRARIPESRNNMRDREIVR